LILQIPEGNGVFPGIPGGGVIAFFDFNYLTARLLQGAEGALLGDSGKGGGNEYS